MTYSQINPTKVGGFLEKLLPPKEVMEKIEIECAIEEQTGKCIHCGLDSHFGYCDNKYSFNK